MSVPRGQREPGRGITQHSTHNLGGDCVSLTFSRRGDLSVSVFAFPSSILVAEDGGWIPELHTVVPYPDEGQFPPRDNHMPEATVQWMLLLILHFAEFSLFWPDLGKSYSFKSNLVIFTILELSWEFQKLEFKT